MTRELNWSKAAVMQHATQLPLMRLCKPVVFAALMLLGCGEAPESTVRSPEVLVDVTSLDGRLQVALPQNLIVHRHKTSIQATEADGTLRYFIGHQPSTKLVRTIGASKSIVTKHQWTVDAEKHYAQASEMRLRRKRPGGEVQERRTIWFVPAGDGVVICDGIAVLSREELLGDPFKTLCTSIHMRAEGVDAKVSPPSTSPTPKKGSEN